MQEQKSFNRHEKNKANNKANNKEKKCTAIVKAGEKGLVKKNPYENIHTVFSLKDLNIKFRNVANSVSIIYKANLIKTNRWVNSIGNKMPNYKTIIITILIILNLVVLFSKFSIKYQVYLNNSFIGIVDNKKDISNIIELAKKQISSEIKTNVSIDYKPTTKVSIQLRAKKYPVEKIIENIKTSGLYNQKVYAINIDGKEVVVLKDKSTANRLLQKIKDTYKVDGTENVKFLEKVEVKETVLENKNVLSIDDALKVLTQGNSEVKEYKVQKGDTLWLIARKNDTRVKDLQKMNPELNENIKEGQIILLGIAKPLITVSVQENSGDKKKITLKTKESTKTTQDSKKEKGSNIVSAPKKRTGVFSRPILGMITSRFGSRWGRQHEGIDIAGRVGKPIYAADGGVVTFSGYLGGYGKLIQIRHNKSYVTYYGHCSKLLIKKGARVRKGQKIALIGMTGHTTGPHLHFEIRKNGVPQNPLKILKKGKY